MSCIKWGDFGRYYKENMDALGLWTPESALETKTTILGNIAVMAGALETLGKTATLKELWIATKRTEKLKLELAISASAYLGASIGSAAVASGRVLGCGATMIDAFATIDKAGIKFQSRSQFFASYPEVLDTRRPARHHFAQKIRSDRSRV